MGEYMKGLSNEDLYKLMSRISLIEAAALTAGIPPDRVKYDQEYDSYGNDLGYCVSLEPKKHDPENASTVFYSVLTALQRAVVFGDLPATISIRGSDYIGAFHNHPDLSQVKTDLVQKIHLSQTTLDREHLKKWFLSHGVKPEAFFPLAETEPYLNQDHHCYAPKLAALVHAWTYVTEHGVPVGSTFKKAIFGYLKEHGHKHTKNGGTLTGKLDDLAAIANWDELGKKAEYLGDLLGVDQEIFEARIFQNEGVYKKQPINSDLVASNAEAEAFLRQVHPRYTPKYSSCKVSELDDDLPF